VVVANRTEEGLAIGPGLTIPPCSTTTIDAREWESARGKGVEMNMDGGPGWQAPAGAVAWDNLAFAFGPGGGSASVIVTSTDAPKWQVPIDEAKLPPCIGQPILDPGAP
jgi:hypothetical protein